MKKTISFLLALVMCLSLYACGGGEKTELTGVMSGKASFISGNDVVSEETPSTSSNDVVSEETYSATEVFAAEFCMAYMNHLKNPYSFTVKSIWAMDNGDGRYAVYVKFTAQNSLGADVADEIGTMTYLTKEQLKELASDGIYVDIYTWGSEPTGKILGDGETLSASKIQTYIDEHYE